MITNRLHKLSKLWQSMFTGSVNSRIVGAAIIVAAGTLFVKIIAVVKELVVAWKFGTADELEAYLIALTIPAAMISIIASSFNAALIPTYIKVREQEGRQAAQQLFCGATVWSIGLLIATTAMMVATAPLYIPQMTRGFSQDKIALTYQLLWILSPLLLLTGVNTVWAAILNAGERFALVALVPILTSVITIAFIFITPGFGVFNLAVGMIVGQFIETAIIGMSLRRQGISLLPKWYGFDRNLKEVAGQYAPMIAGAFLMCSTDLVDRSMAAMLPSGSVAALSYGSRIISLPIIIATTAVSTAIIPYLSKMVAIDDWAGVRSSLKRYMALIFAVTVPLTLGIILFSEPIVYALLQRGSFTAENTRTVAQIQACFALQIPFYIASVLAVRLNSAMRNNKLMMWGSAGNLIVNIVLNYTLMQWLGVAGIALSTSFVYIFSFCFLTYFAVRNLKKVDNLGLTPEQQERLEELKESKKAEIEAILTPEQRQALSQVEEMQRPSRYQRRHGLDLSADQKNQLAAIRQQTMAQIRTLLTPEQERQLQEIPSSQTPNDDNGNWDLSLSRVRKLTLHPAQKERIAQIWAQERQQMDAVLTPEQRQKNQTRQSTRHAVNGGWRKLNLTAEQKAKLRAIRQAKKQQLNSILTPEQQAKIKEGNGKYRL